MRLLHTMLRVTDLTKSINFYTQVLDMTLLRQSENVAYQYTLAFLGYGQESDTTVLELTYNWSVTQYDIGNSFGHIAIETDDIYATCDSIKAMGSEITREAGPVKGGSTIIAFVKDPDGYMIELIANKNASNKISE